MPPLCKEHKAMGGVFSLVKRMSTEICLTGIVERCNEMNTQRQPIGQAFDLAVGCILKTP